MNGIIDTTLSLHVLTQRTRIFTISALKSIYATI
jgi:hypothetical protein